jgi:hypothetical protein
MFLFTEWSDNVMEKEWVKIEEARKQMIQLALKLGFDHPYVIELSRRLDQLHNQWNEIQKGKSKYPDSLKESPLRYRYGHSCRYA